MAMQPVYLVAISNLAKFLEALRHAVSPDKVKVKFIEELGFTSTNDRLFIPLLRAMKFIDETGKPTDRYHSFLDDTNWKFVLADGIRDAFPELFRVNRTAHTMGREQLAGKIKSLCEGKISESVLRNITKTFMELVKLADFSQAKNQQQSPESQTIKSSVENSAATQTGANQVNERTPIQAPTFAYRIEIILPSTRDQSVYDAIFKSAKEHLLK